MIFYVRDNTGSNGYKNGRLVPAKFLTDKNGNPIRDPNTTGDTASINQAIYDASGNLLTGADANPNGYLIAPANYSFSDAQAFAATVHSQLEDGNADLAAGAMTGEFFPGGPMDYQQSYETVDGTSGNGFVKAFTDFTSYNLGYVASYASLPVEASEVGGGLLNEILNYLSQSRNLPTDGPYGLTGANGRSIEAGYGYAQLESGATNGYFNPPTASDENNIPNNPIPLGGVLGGMFGDGSYYFGGAIADALGGMAGAFGRALAMLTPIALDLNGDGIKYTTLANSKVHFDIDNDKFAEHVEWVSPQDGFLVRDLNGNGQIDNVGEMFGETGGTTAYQKLAALDTNKNGKIDAGDTAFASLRVWQDSNSDGLVETGELKTLAQWGIASLSLEQSTATTLNGHAVAGTSSYTMTNGTVRTAADVLLQTDQVDSWYVGNSLTVTNKVNMSTIFLPQSRGYGTIPTLALAMSFNANLEKLVLNFANTSIATGMHTVYAQVDAIILAWTGATNVAAHSRGDYIDARHLVALEAINGQPYTQTPYGPLASDPLDEAAHSLAYGYNLFANEMLSRLLIQGPLQPIFANAVYDYTTDTIVFHDSLATILARAKAHAPAVGTADAMVYWSEIARIATHDSASFSTSAAAAKTAVDKAAGFTTTIITVFGGSGNDFLEVDSARPNGGANDVFWGGLGNDVMNGLSGNDTYIHAQGDGSDTINETRFDGKGDTLKLMGAALTSTHVSVTRSADLNSVTLKFAGVTDAITLTGEYSGAETGVENIVFSNGVTWHVADLEKKYLTTVSTSGNDNIHGFTNVNDIITGGLGNDVMDGLSGNDTYIHAQGDGVDTINEVLFYGTGDTLKLTGAALTSTGVSLSRSADLNSVTLKFAGVTDAITLTGEFRGAETGVENIVFSNGVTWHVADIEKKYLTAVSTTGNDDIHGFNDANDVITGGLGNDIMDGGNGNDTYIHAQGDGVDTINETLFYGDGDTLKLTGAALTSTGVSLSRSADLNSVTLKFAGVTDAITLTGEFRGAETGIENIVFSNGVTWHLADIEANYLAHASTSGNDVTNGFDDRDDTILGSLGADKIDGQAGTDTISYAASTAAVTVNLATNVNSGGYAAGDSLANIENIIGSSYNDKLTGTSGDNSLTGHGGSDTFTGGGGYDHYILGTTDTVTMITNGLSTNSAASGELDASVAHNRLWFVRNGNDLDVDVLGTTQQAVIKNWYAGSTAKWQQLQEIVGTDHLKIDSSLQSLVEAMATFGTTNPAFNAATTTHTSLGDTAYFSGALATAYSTAWHA